MKSPVETCRLPAGGITPHAPHRTGAFEAKLMEVLEEADIRLGGSRPWDPHIIHSRMFDRVRAQGSLGLGEAYMDGDWECERLDEFVHRLLRARAEVRLFGQTFAAWWDLIRTRLVNLQRPSRAFEVGRRHYDLGNDLFEAMLDRRMVYSGAYWAGASTLDEAQEAKLELICRKLALEPGMRVLDIGCGWASFLQYAAERHGINGAGITISKEQAELGRRRCQGLPIEIQLRDYRELKHNGGFDRIVSIGMIEHVGWRNYRALFEVVHRCLRPGGRFLLQSIGRNEPATTMDPWIETYIFPNSMIPAASQLATASEGLLVLEDWHSIGPHYDRTLMAWFNNFERAWPSLKERYGESFHRMWKYYLLSCAGCFRARRQQLWQILFSRDGISGGYER
ncbi:cyclopropane fatty acyl phospholipid synthase [bacterium]|nr:cyclopropane fatty acyl phospholipid synthase [bacterium]